MNHPDPFDESLDRALRAALPPPELPADFRRRLQARLERSSAADLVIRRRMLDQERREQLEGFRADSVRLTWQTLACLVGGAFAAGVAVVLAMPWFRASFGDAAGLAVLLCSAASGLAIAAYALIQRQGLPRWLV